MRFIQANTIYCLSQAPLQNGIIQISSEGMIEGIYAHDTDIPTHFEAKVEKFEGVICPGFVNAHCHLELSHLYQKVPKHQGLTAFISEMIQNRGQFSEEIQLKAMELATAEMWANGIVAVGDITNHDLSKLVKKNSTLFFHTFIEVMGFNPQMAENIYAQALEMANSFADMPHSIVPHAPYSVSELLFQKIADGKAALSSMHNQECAAENEWFVQKSGLFKAFYEKLGIEVSHFHAKGKNSLPSVLPLLSPSVPTVLVHNTFSSREDIAFAEETHPNLYWCLCPNANLYIENTLPPLDLLLEMKVKMVLGTDSLASNDQLSIAAEMWTLQQHFDISLSQLLEMACWNAAQFLGIDAQFGSIEVGKKPGLVLLQAENDKLTNSNVLKIE